MKAEIAASQGVIFVTPDTEPLDSRRAQECAGPRLTSLRPERLGRQAGGRHRCLHGRHRHRHGPGSDLRNIVAYLDMPTLNAPEAYLKFDDQTVASPTTSSATKAHASSCRAGSMPTWPG